jgi:ubiquinone/menaquinone biosynthesis C-methylase UbiE
MADHICPPWVGRLLLNPLRKLVESPKKIFNPFVEEGMVVLEPGCAMGFFTLPLARMVGPEGKVVAVDIQSEMLTALERRARRKGLIDRIEIRQASSDGLGIDDYAGSVDFCPVLHVAHEVPDQNRFFQDIANALSPGARLLVIEPRGHVSEEDFEVSLSAAEAVGLRRIESPDVQGDRKALLERIGK